MEKLLSILSIFIILQNGNSALNLRQQDLSLHQPRQNQYFIETPENQTVIEGGSVTLKCKIGNLAGKVQWTADGFALGHTRDTIKGVCPKCSSRGDHNKGEFHMHVEDISLGAYGEGFECQVAPTNSHKAIRASAYLNVIVPPDKLELVNTDQTISMTAGTVREMSCMAKGAKPRAKITWYHGANRILDQEYTSQTVGGNRDGTWDYVETLKFRAKPRDDGTKVRCVVGHEALRDKAMEKQIDLIVFYSPGEPKIIGDTKRAHTQGDMINITCSSSGGNPAPYVTWYKNNNPLNFPYELLDNGTTISTLSLRAEPNLLTDKFSCRAGNRETQPSLHSKAVKFNVTFSGEGVRIAGPNKAQLGSEIQLTCSSEESNPPSNIVWAVDGRKRGGRDNQEHVAVSGGGWKTISTIKFMVDVNLSEMKVTCSAINEQFKDEIQQTKTIQILRPPEAPSISGLPSNSLREGDSLTLSCMARHGSPLPKLKWFKKGEPIKNQNFTLVPGSHSISYMNILVSRSDNDVVYRCEANNQAHFPTASQSTNFSVYFEPLEARLYLSRTAGGPEVVHSKSGDQLQLNCEAGNSNPPAKINWFKNGKEIRGGPFHSSPSKYGGVRRSQVVPINEGDPVTSADDGTKFACLVTNPAINGRNISRDFVLNVQYSPEFSTSSPGNYSVLEGERVIMSVETEANPQVQQYLWYTGDQPNKPHMVHNLPDRFSISGPTMTITDTRRQDAGLYIFGAENKVGETRKEIRLNVHYHPRIKNLTTQIIADEGQQAVFHCVVDANPIDAQTVIWGASGGHGREMDFDERGAVFEYDGKMTFTMTLSDVKKSDRGKFFCLADNKLKNAQPDRSETVLKVNFKPELRKFPRYAQFAQNLMHQISLDCVAYGYPNVTIFWRKNGNSGNLRDQRYHFDNRGITTQVDYGTWKSELVIESVLKEDYTSYECIAQNQLGEDRHNISLTTPSIPDSPTGLQVTKIDYQTVQLKWEPGFNGGFTQSFVTKVVKVRNGGIREEKVNSSRLGRDEQFVHQIVKLETNAEYIFSVMARNVQGQSHFSNEEHKSLRASENRKKEDNRVPRVIIVAVVLGCILLVIIILMIITCCVKQRKENRRREEKNNDRSSSVSSKKSMMIERYPPSKYSQAFGTDMFISPPSNSGSSLCGTPDPQDYKYLSRSLSMPGQDQDEIDRGYTSYTGSCSVHGGTLHRGGSHHHSSGIDTTTEDEVFDDYPYKNGGPGYPVITADKMLKGGGGRNRAGSVSSPTCHAPSGPHLGVSGLYTNHMERRAGVRKYSGGSVSPPPNIPSPPPPVSTSTLDRLKKQNMGGMPPIPVPSMGNGHLKNGVGNMNSIKLVPPEMEKLEVKSAVEISNELTKRINDLGRDRSVEPPDSLAHLQLQSLPSIFNHQPGRQPNPSNPIQIPGLQHPPPPLQPFPLPQNGSGSRGIFYPPPPQQASSNFM